MGGEANKVTLGEVFSESNFGTFYTAYYKRFFRYACYYVNHVQAAEDITHDAILSCWENRSKLPPDTDILGYMLLTVRNKCLNHLKHLKVESEYGKQCVELHDWEVKARIMALEDEHYADIFTGEIKRIVKQTLAELPEQTRYIFVQHRFRCRPRKEIAAELGTSLSKIDYHINKASQHLFNELKDYSPLLAVFFQSFFD
ncbi:MAG: RNA polymerase sigma-70 factor [Tannerella sp.]|jgi:RNA polymerase sigma-70 factor (ECF subfamily)|nr:RNA polymerase sigma-70 factor [Tannerella sp.]